MKKHFILFLFSFLMISSAVYADNQSALVLSVWDGRNFTAEINGKKYSSYGETLEINPLKEGRYQLKIFDADGGYDRILYSDYIGIQKGYRIYAAVDEEFKLVVYKKTAYNDYGTENRYGQECRCNCEYCRNCIYKNGNSEHSHNTITIQAFEELMESVNSKSYDDSKKEIILFALGNNYFKSEQVKMLVGSLSFEINKLEVAKYAYDRTTDKSNYYKVFDAFSFESTIKQLRDYIDSR